MPWNPLTSDDVLEEFTPQEQAMLKNIQGVDTDTLTGIVQRVLQAMRGSILAGGGRLDVDGTIPDQLRGEAIDIIRWRFLISFPTLKSFQTEARKKAHDEAKDTLKEIAASKMKVEAPATVTPQVTLSPSPQFERRRHEFSPNDERGI